MALVSGLNSTNNIENTKSTNGALHVTNTSGRKLGTTTVLDLTTTTDVALQATTTAVDIQVDAVVDVYLSFAAGPSAATAPYKLWAGSQQTLSVDPDDAVHLYFATAGEAFAAGDYIRLQEWEG